MVIIPFPHYGAFTNYTPVIPSFYWDVYSSEQRIHALCKEYAKLIAFTDSMVDTVNAQYGELIELKEDFLQYVEEAIGPALDDYTENGALRQLMDQEFAALDERVDILEGKVATLEGLAVVMTGATASTAGAAGFVPAPVAGDNAKYLSGAGTWETISGGGGTDINIEIDSVTLGTAGTLNLIPGANATISGTIAGTTARLTIDSTAAGIDGIDVSAGGTTTTEATAISFSDSSSVAFNNAGSATITAEVPAMTGATSSLAGASGLVPAPAAGDDVKFLSGAGTWETVQTSQAQADWDEADTTAASYIQNKPVIVDGVPPTLGTQIMTANGVNSFVTGKINDQAALDSLNKLPIGAKIVFVGDSFLQGYATEGMQTDYGTFIANAISGTAQKLAEGGAGFYQTGQSGHTFLQLLQNATIDSPDAFIIAGGYNDQMAQVSPANIASAGTALIQWFNANYPTVPVYVFPMIWGNGNNNSLGNSYGYPDEDNCKALRDAILSADAKGQARVQMGCWTWLYGSTSGGLVSSDNVHPLTAGHRIIANSMIQAINGFDPTIYYQNVFVSGTLWAMRIYLGLYIQLGGQTGNATLPNYFYGTQAAAAVSSGSSSALGLWLLRDGYTLYCYNGAATNVWGSMFTRMSTSRY